MRTVRYNTFETNSSSTHAMLIPTELPKVLPKKINFHFGQFEWEIGDANPRDYLYTAIYCYYTQEEAEEKVNTIKHALDAVGIYYDFEEPKFNSYNLPNGEVDYYLDNGDIDHSEELGEFLEEVFSNKEFLISFLVDGKVRTGNDNCCEEDSIRYWYPDDWETKNYIRCYKGN